MLVKNMKTRQGGISDLTVNTASKGKYPLSSPPIISGNFMYDTFLVPRFRLEIQHQLGLMHLRVAGVRDINSRKCQ
jgi:hypothetical protein